MDKDISKYLVERLASRQGRLFIMKWMEEREKYEDDLHDLKKGEGRVYSDDELKKLPLYNGKNKALSKEWKQKKHISDLFLTYLRDNFAGQKYNVLDLGCGNGWLANRMSQDEKASVYALDVIKEELYQASLSFDKPNLQFIYGNFYRDILPSEKFDVIVMSNTLMHFQSLDTLMRNVLKVLKPDGELHIFNSKFYPLKDIEKHESQTKEELLSKGKDALLRQFYHHSIEEFSKFKPKVMYDPSKIGAKLSRKLLGVQESPHFWLKIKK